MKHSRAAWTPNDPLAWGREPDILTPVFLTMDNQPASETHPEKTIPVVGVDLAARAKAAGLRVVQEEELDVSNTPDEGVVAPHRLENHRRPSAVRPLGGVRGTVGESEVSPREELEPPRQEREMETEWGAAAAPRARVGKLALSVAAGLLAMLLLGSVIFLLRGDRSDGLAVARAEPTKTPVAQRQDRLQWFRQNPDLADKQSSALLNAFVGAASVEEVTGLVHDAERLEPLLREHWRPVGSPLRRSTPDTERAFSDVGGVPFFHVTAELEDFRQLRVYFVRDDGKMKIDWKATVGYCSVPADRLTRTQGLRGVEIRCIIEARPVSMLGYPSSDYNGYLLSIPGSQDLIWGLATIGSEVDDALLDALDRERFLLELKTSQRVTLEIDEAPGAPANYFIISKLNHVEWVGP